MYVAKTSVMVIYLNRSLSKERGMYNGQPGEDASSKVSQPALRDSETRPSPDAEGTLTPRAPDDA